ncbi:MAG: dihydropteroate synthase [Candidatus Omnitrophota bacterium]
MAIRILSIQSKQGLLRLFRDLKVDPYGISIMLPKAVPYCIRIDALSCIAANILKQEMLSAGGDAALPRGALTGKTRSTDCVLIGNLSQFSKLIEKLRKQPFGLAKLGVDIKASVAKYAKQSFTLSLRRNRLHLGGRPKIMGIMNLTPDSFSGDGLYARQNDIGNIVECAQTMVRDGADLIDIGGESSRPGANPVPVKEELRRTIPAIKAIAKKVKVPLSIDTYKPDVARAALDNGASMINDISGLRNREMVSVAKKYKAAVVIMHMQRTPQTMQKNPRYGCVTADVIKYLNDRVAASLDAGIGAENIVIDPGIGFGKTISHNLKLLRGLKEFKILGLPIMVGTSRKGFIGALTGADAGQRIPGTIASCVLAVNNGAHIVRVHDVKQIKQALQVTRAVLND